MPIKALLFDSGFTLQNDGRIFRECLDFIGKWLKEQRAISSIKRFKKTYLGLDSKMHSPEYSHVFGELEIMKAALEELNADESIAGKAIQEWHSFQKKLFKLNKEFKKALAWAKDNGYKTAIVSNDRIERINALLETHKVKALLDTVIVSEALGFEKPNPRIFQTALKKLNVKPEKAIMFGDNPVSDGASKKLGIKWVKVQKFDQGQIWEKGEAFTPDFEIGEINKENLKKAIKTLS